MFLLSYELRPSIGRPELSEFAGAFVNCWIKRDTLSEAQTVAAYWITDAGWQIVAIERAASISKETVSEEGREFFEQAQIDGEVFVYYTCPADDTSSEVANT